jgi:hypothetical protein
MSFSNPNAEVFLPSLTKKNQEEFSEQTDNLWGQMQTGNVSSPVS